jgi:hypothetical protein
MAKKKGCTMMARKRSAALYVMYGFRLMDTLSRTRCVSCARSQSVAAGKSSQGTA